MNQMHYPSRRQWLRQAACGFGSLALTGLAQRTSATETPLAGNVVASHFVPRVKRVIFLFMQGGPSQVDTFDYKPLLEQRDGQSYDFADDRVRAKTGVRQSAQRVMKSPWKFQQYGQSGAWASDLFHETARHHADSLCMIHSMHTDGVAHGPATLFLHCGATNFVRPSMGSWITYGLGSENENLPGFVTISPSAGNGGPRNYGNAFLPSAFQGTAVGSMTDDEIAIPNLQNPQRSWQHQRQQLDLTLALNRQQLAKQPSSDELENVVRSYELAWRMQTEAPDVFDLGNETQPTLAMYGIGQKNTDRFGKQCLLARRLCESGVRYIQVNYGDNTANPAWDQHSNLPKHEEHARRVDKPIAGLLSDLKQRGLLEDTLVWWGSEFGRTPYAQDNGTGRDHNPSGFTTWLAGGGIRPGYHHGKTDEFGHQAIEGKVHMHDLHATILRLLGIDHEKLTYRHDGRNFRLTDVHGRVIDEILV
jgi:hypothetical protein